MKAIQFDNENKPFVYYADEKGKVQSKPVTIGINDGITVEIKEGVSAGDIIFYPEDDDQHGRHDDGIGGDSCEK